MWVVNNIDAPKFWKRFEGGQSRAFTARVRFAGRKVTVIATKATAASGMLKLYEYMHPAISAPPGTPNR